MTTATTPLDVVIVSYNTCLRTLACLRSVVEHAHLPAEIVVADNASGDGSPAAIREAFPQVRLLEMGANLGFAAANNRALRATASPFVLLLNSDAELRPGALAALHAALAARPEVAAVGPRTLNSDGSLQISWGSDLSPLSEWRERRLRARLRRGDNRAVSAVDAASRRTHEPDWLSGSCMLVRREALVQVGFFDEGYFLYEEDADLGLRLRRAGWRLLFCPTAEVLHEGGASAPGSHGPAQIEYHRSHLRYYARHRGPLQSSALRAWLAARALAGWLCAPGDAPRRSYWWTVAGLALGIAGGRRHVLR